MIWQALFAWLHLLAAGAAGGLLLAQRWLLARPLDRRQARLLGLADLAWLLAGICTIATGIARLQHFGREPAWYQSNPLLWSKLGAVAALALIAVVPSAQYLRWNREARALPSFAPLGREVERVRACLAVELALFALLPLFSVLLARGYGY